MEKLYVTKGYTGAHNVRGKKTNQNDTYIEFENIPLAGFKLGKNNGEMVDPRGFIIKVGSSTMDRLLRTCIIYNVTILNTLVYRRFGSYYCPTHPDYKEEVAKKMLLRDIPLFSIFKRSARGMDLINLGDAGKLCINDDGEFFISKTYKNFVVNAHSVYGYPQTLVNSTTVREPSKIETSLSHSVTNTLRNYLNYAYSDTFYPSAFNVKKIKLAPSGTINHNMFGINGYKFVRAYSSKETKKLPLYYIDDKFNVSSKDMGVKGKDLFLVLDANDKLLGRIYLPDQFKRYSMINGHMISYELVGYILNERFAFSGITVTYA